MLNRLPAGSLRPRDRVQIDAATFALVERTHLTEHGRTIVVGFVNGQIRDFDVAESQRTALAGASDRTTPSGTVAAETDEVHEVSLDAKACLASDLLSGLVDCVLDVGGHLDVLHRAAVGADEVMVVVVGEVFGEFVVGVVAVGDDAVNETEVLERGEVSIDRALRE
jgi:hypothetical protein